MEEGKYTKVTFHYNATGRKDLGRPCKNWQQSWKMLEGLSHDRKTKNKLIINVTVKLIEEFYIISFYFEFLVSLGISS